MQNGPEKKPATVRKNDLPVPSNLRRDRPLWPVIQQLLQVLQPPPSSHRFGIGRAFGSTWIGQHYWAQEIPGLSIEAGARNGYQRCASHIKPRAFGSAGTRRRRWRLWRDQIWSGLSKCDSFVSDSGFDVGRYTRRGAVCGGGEDTEIAGE